MSAAYFAIACVVMVLVIYWGSAEPEPTKLARFFGRRPWKSESKPTASKFKKRQ
jgi:hypothetical protein